MEGESIEEVSVPLFFYNSKLLNIVSKTSNIITLFLIFFLSF